jgi:hypothetical protein
MGTLSWDFTKKYFENLGIVLYSIEMLSEKLCFRIWRKGGE